MSETTLANLDTVLGKLVVDQGLATVEEVAECMAIRKEQSGQSGGGSAHPQSLADIMVAKGVLTRKQVDRVRPIAEDQKTPQQIPGYQVLERLGAGAMATVYKAKQMSLDRLV